MAKTITIVLFAAAIGFVGYLAYSGVTWSQARGWVERQIGVRVEQPELRNVPHPGYAPVVMPGK